MAKRTTGLLNEDAIPSIDANKASFKLGMRHQSWRRQDLFGMLHVGRVKLSKPSFPSRHGNLTRRFDTSGKSGARFHNSENPLMPSPRNSEGTHRATAGDHLRVVEPRAHASRNPDMSTTPDLAMTASAAATGQTNATAAPRIKLLAHGFAIDHPDPEIGERLMADAMGVADREAMHGIIRQLVRASVNGGSPDEVNLSFMMSMMKSIKPRDSIEAMLVAQMVSVHVMAMRCAHHLANAELSLIHI